MHHVVAIGFIEIFLKATELQVKNKMLCAVVYLRRKVMTKHKATLTSACVQRVSDRRCLEYNTYIFYIHVERSPTNAVYYLSII